MNKLKKTEKLGDFEVVSGVLRISDPCYDRDTWCAGTISNVLNGKWYAEVDKYDCDEWGHRVGKLRVFHGSADPEEFPSVSDVFPEACEFEVGVDSGQAGIFDEEFYQVDYKEPYDQTGRKEYDDSGWQRMLKDAKEFKETITGNLGVFKGSDLLKSQEEMIRTCEEQLNGEPSKTTDWYEICCDKTLSKLSAGVIKGGAVSSSGYGDGGYSASYKTDENGKVVFVEIDFGLEYEEGEV